MRFIKNLLTIIILLMIIAILAVAGLELLKHTEKKPLPPRMIDPGQETLSGIDYRLSWEPDNSGPPVNSYILQSATDSNFTQDVDEHGPLTGRSVKITSPPISEDTAFYFRVKSGVKSRWSKNLAWSPWSSGVDILVKHVPALDLSIKGNITKRIAGQRFTLKWSSSKQAVDYTLEESIDPLFQDSSKTTWNKKTTKTVFTPPAVKISQDQTYYYRVRANNKNGPMTVWSNISKIQIRASALWLVTKGKIKEVDAEKSVMLNWGGVKGASYFMLEESTDKTFKDTSQRTLSKRLTGSKYTLPGKIVEDDTDYYYRLRAYKNKKPISSWSSVTRIKVIAPKVPEETITVVEKQPEPEPATQVIQTVEKQTKVTGLWVARHVFDRDRGENSISDATMVLLNEKNNSKKTRNFTHHRRMKNELEKQLIRFISPADIEGTGFLIVENPGYETEQLLYLPALRRSRRIASSQKHHRFVNSDFSYEDMERHPVEDYTYALGEDKSFSGLLCYNLETRPKEGVVSQYSLIKSLVDKKSFVPVYAEYYDETGKHIKTYEVAKLELRQSVWTEMMSVMKDLTKNHTTYIKVNNIKYNTTVGDHEISRSALENY